MTRPLRSELMAKFKPYLNPMADEVLIQVERIAVAAKAKLAEGSVIPSEALAQIQTMTTPAPLLRLTQVSHAVLESCQVLAKEPAIARVVVKDGEDRRLTYYICRTSAAGIPNLASYRAPIGRLASLSVGEDLTLENGTVLEVLERAQLRPMSLHDGWDCRDTIVEGEHFGPLTIESLRALLREFAGEEVTEDLLGRLLAEEGLKANVIEGVRRGVITRMGLRDQPILDRYQDEIFRLPLDARLLILGAPGTGKTTTLIRRLGQKLDAASLGEAEQSLVESASEIQQTPHSESWMMFTPTDLLKQFLKEAFARERVPASDLRIKTWQEYRRDLARNTFKILRTAKGGGTFVEKEGIQNLSPEAMNRPIHWFNDFHVWQRAKFVQDLGEAARVLACSQSPEAREIGQRLAAILTRADHDTLPDVFEELSAEIPRIKDFIATLKAGSDAKIKAALNLQLNRSSTFLDELVRVIDELQPAEAEAMDEDQDDVDIEDDEELVETRTDRAGALNAYIQAVRADARAAASNRTLNRTSRNAKVMQWLSSRSLAEPERIEVGISLQLQSGARHFVNPVKRHIDGIPRRYRAFRRLRQTQDTWYVRERFEGRVIHPLEMDIVLLSVLRTTRDLLGRSDIRRKIDDPPWSMLKPVLEQYRNQIFVDEATDFSPIQLACMAALGHPTLRSFFACGDFNQRLTAWGSQSVDDLKWIFPDLDVREVTITYRHSKQLNELARAIIHAVGGADQTVALPPFVDNEGVAPALLESANEMPRVVQWLANRIREIERFVGRLPSIAIFVNSEAEVGPMADALRDALAEDNVQVMACRDGQAVGQDTSVRVFHVQHIKGLEFEAVFFITVDQLAGLYPDLFEKYLYVGATRAATYLGLTCEGALPAVIQGLRPLFTHDWGSPGITGAES